MMKQSGSTETLKARLRAAAKDRLYHFTLADETIRGVMVHGTQMITDMRGGGDLLFDLALDPKEKVNLFGDRADPAQRLKAEGLEWYERTAEAFPDAYQPSVPELLEEFKRLGYTGGE